MADEPHLAVWREYAADAEARGTVPALYDRFPQFRFPIRAGISQDATYRAATRRGEAGVGSEELQFEDPAGVSILVHDTPAGAVPVLVARARADFETLVRAFSERNEPALVPEAMGACLVGGINNWDRIARHRQQWESERAEAAAAPEWDAEFRRLTADKSRYQDRILLLSSGPYSAVPASEAGRSEEEWLRESLRIRLDHECFHYLTSRLFGLIRSNLLDELLADYAGLVGAYGEYRAELGLRFLGVEKDGTLRNGARLRVYRGALSDGGLAVLGRLAVRVSEGLEGSGDKELSLRLLGWAGMGLVGLVA